MKAPIRIEDGLTAKVGRNGALTGTPIQNGSASAASAEVGSLVRQPRYEYPKEALNQLYRLACLDTGGAQAARSFLFSLPGLPDPTGYKGEGALEVRRLDADNFDAAVHVFTWWGSGMGSGQPLYDVLAQLEQIFKTSNETTNPPERIAVKPAPEDDYTDRRGIASRYKVSVRKIDKLRKQKVLPFYKIPSRCIRFRISECDAAIAQYRRAGWGENKQSIKK